MYLRWLGQEQVRECVILRLSHLVRLIFVPRRHVRSPPVHEWDIRAPFHQRGSEITSCPSVHERDHPSISVGNEGHLSLILLYLCIYHSNVVVSCLMFCDDLSSSIVLKTLCKTSENPVKKGLLWRVHVVLLLLCAFVVCKWLANSVYTCECTFEIKYSTWTRQDQVLYLTRLARHCQ